MQPYTERSWPAATRRIAGSRRFFHANILSCARIAWVEYSQRGAGILAAQNYGAFRPNLLRRYARAPHFRLPQPYPRIAA
jgi:hypothetical protein